MKSAEHSHYITKLDGYWKTIRGKKERIRFEKNERHVKMKKTRSNIEDLPNKVLGFPNQARSSSSRYRRNTNESKYLH